MAKRTAVLVGIVCFAVSGCETLRFNTYNLTCRIERDNCASGRGIDCQAQYNECEEQAEENAELRRKEREEGGQPIS